VEFASTAFEKRSTTFKTDCTGDRHEHTSTATSRERTDCFRCLPSTAPMGPRDRHRGVQARLPLVRRQRHVESFASEIALIIEELAVGTSDWWPPYIEMVRVIDVFNANAVPNPIVGDAMREILRDLVDDVQANPAVIPAA
jgi:hypothetical protein